MKTKTGRYSGYIRPFSYLIDWITINLLAIYIVPFHENQLLYSLYISVTWFGIAIYLGFYEVYRYTKVITILNCAFKQFVSFALFCLAIELNYSELGNQKKVVLFVFISLCIILFVKLFIYFFLKKYRVLYGANFRTVVLLGSESKIEPLKSFFNNNLDYGYKLSQVFISKIENNAVFEACKNYVSQNRIDEIYCSTADLSDFQIKDIIDFADNNLKTLKFIPDDKQLLSGKVKFEYYDYIPVISSRTILQDETINKIFKRLFDIVFSILVIVGLLSWLIPIVALLIKLDSKGPVFFIQKRNGLNYKEFNCFKFRSMNLNEKSDIDLATKNDVRITKIGEFLRRNSIDELPQFFNVLLGDMSVVGPRPHMLSIANVYSQKVDKFMVRHFVKPGITGLAQTKGFRGEVETEDDIINRVKYDIFYMENWSMLLDIEIIFITTFQILKGDEKAF